MKQRKNKRYILESIAKINLLCRTGTRLTKNSKPSSVITSSVISSNHQRERNQHPRNPRPGKGKGKGKEKGKVIREKNVYSCPSEF